MPLYDHWVLRRQRPCHRAAILPESVGVVKRLRPAGRGPRTPWRAGGSGQTTARAGGLATSRREREGRHRLVVSRSRQSDRGLWAVAYSREPEMHEDPVHDSGVVDSVPPRLWRWAS